MEVNSLQILLVDVTFYLKKIKTRSYAAPAVKGLKKIPALK